jgi:hypothetical protein
MYATIHAACIAVYKYCNLRGAQQVHPFALVVRYLLALDVETELDGYAHQLVTSVVTTFACATHRAKRLHAARVSSASCSVGSPAPT